MLDRATPGLAEDAHAVRVVHDDDGVELARELDDLRQLREVALHREDTVRDDQLSCLSRSVGERIAKRARVEWG